MIGVYYLWDGTTVLYVGASRHVERRIADHRRARLDFAGYFVDQCPANELDDREAKAIAEFRPLLNEQRRPDNLLGNQSQACFWP